MRKTLIIGATSAIAMAVARRCATGGDKLFLIARNDERLAAIAADLRIRGAAEVGQLAMDANEFARHEAAVQRAFEALGAIDLVLIAHGTLGDQKASQASAELTRQELDTNAISVISLLTLLANRMEAQRSGSIAVIGSVAGDRGRQSNYVYGTAKAALATFLQGLRNRLHKSGVKVITIKPGFVDTPMTASFKKGALWASPDAIAAGILKAVERGSDEVYLPFFWRYIMLIITSVPERLFKKLSL